MRKNTHKKEKKKERKKKVLELDRTNQAKNILLSTIIIIITIIISSIIVIFIIVISIIIVKIATERPLIKTNLTAYETKNDRFKTNTLYYKMNIDIF